MTSDTAERGLERLICTALTGAPCNPGAVPASAVREAAARLPQEAEDLEPLDEADVEGDADEADARDTDEIPEESEA